jgi:hypothetical protein
MARSPQHQLLLPAGPAALRQLWHRADHIHADHRHHAGLPLPPELLPELRGARLARHRRRRPQHHGLRCSVLPGPDVKRPLPHHRVSRDERFDDPLCDELGPHQVRAFVLSMWDLFPSAVIQSIPFTNPSQNIGKPQRIQRVWPGDRSRVG